MLNKCVYLKKDLHIRNFIAFWVTEWSLIEGEMPPSDNVVHMLNGAEDFMEMARKLNLVRSRRLLRRRRRMAEYETSSYEMGERWDSNQYEISSSDERFMNWVRIFS